MLNVDSALHPHNLLYSWSAASLGLYYNLQFYAEGLAHLTRIALQSRCGVDKIVYTWSEDDAQQRHTPCRHPCSLPLMSGLSKQGINGT